MAGVDEPARTLIRGGLLVLPDADEGVRARTGDLLIEGDRIAAVGSVESVPRGARVLYAAGCALLPGFVQGHVHLHHGLLRGSLEIARRGELQERVLWPLEAAQTPESVRAAARLSVAELLLSGTTALRSMEGVHHAGIVCEVLAEAGLFALSGKSLMDRAGAAPEALVQDTEEALAEAVDLAENWDGVGGRLAMCLQPRSLSSCSDACLQAVADVAEAGAWPVHLQLVESFEERDRLRRAGREPLDRLVAAGLLGERCSLTHCAWLGPREAELLATTHTGVVLCPGAEGRLGLEMGPLAAPWRFGIAASVGVDGAAGNDSLSLWREMRQLASRPPVGLDPARLGAARSLDLATRGGAEALGLDEEIGSLETGKFADLLLVNLEGLHAAPARDPLAALVFACGAADVRAVWLAGKQVVSEGRLLLWDEEQVRRDARRQAAALFARAGLG